MISLETFTALKSEETALQALAAADLSAVLPLLTKLRKTYFPQLAAALLETAQLRRKAISKFSRADQMFFTEDALQQATHETVAQYHANLLREFTCIADLGCSIGGDSLAIGQQTQVIGLDRDPVRLQMARHNASVYDAQAEFVQADLTDDLPLQHIPAAFFDPARRSDSRRIFSIRDYVPPLDSILTWNFQAMLVKISPGVDLAEIKHLPVGIEFISHAGDLKEALLHAGDLYFEGFRATLLPRGKTLVSQGLEPPPVTDTPRRYLYEPDPAVIRSGLFGEMLAQLGLEAYRFDETIAYLTGDEAIQTDWLRVWQIDDWMPFNRKHLQAALRERNIGKITVKKRGSPITPEELQKMLRLRGDRHAVLTLTRLQGQPIVLISLD